MAYLTAEYLAYSYADISADLRAIFDEQYVLTYTERTVTRYGDPGDSDNDGDTEPYDWHILTVKLETKPLADIIGERMDEEQRKYYEVLMNTKGGRQYAGSPFAFDWKPYITSYYGWRQDPHSGEKAFHDAIDIGVAVVNSLSNARIILDQIMSGRNDLHFIEVMSCPGGCVGGGGQPLGPSRGDIMTRLNKLYEIDSSETGERRVSHRNEEVRRLYEDFLGKPLGPMSHELLHTHYHDRPVSR